MARGKPKEKAQILERQLEALSLRRRGLSYRAIGEKLGVSHEQARRDIDGELVRLARERDTNLEAERELELVRLDKIFDALDHWVNVGNPQVINAYLKAMERRAKLLGLDAPDKKELSGKDGGAIQIQWVDALTDDDETGIGADELPDAG